MLLEINNFRCWKKKSFTFPDQGLVLLNGASGSGKSSILNAIYFVLYGIGTKIITTGEKKCSVHFVYNEFDIIRSKGPNRLVLVYKGEEYEDEIGQQIINKHFGTNFTLTSYVTQKMVSSFLNMGPTDKMNFLEQLALGDENITEIKKKTKDNIREKKEILLQKIGQLEVISKEVGEMKTPEEVQFPLEGKPSDIKIKNEAVYWKRTIKSLQEDSKKKRDIESEISSENIKIALFEKQTKITIEYQQKLNKLSSEKINYEGDENLSSMKDTLQFLKDKREFTNINNRYIEEKKNFENLLKQEMENLERERESLQKEIDETTIVTDGDLENIKDTIKILEEVELLERQLQSSTISLLSSKSPEKIQEEINDLEKIIENDQKTKLNLEQRLDIKRCPCCKSSLRIFEGDIVPANFGDDSDGPVDFFKAKADIKLLATKIISNKKKLETLKSELFNVNNLIERKKTFELELSEYEIDRDLTIPSEKESYNYHRKLRDDRLNLEKKILILNNRINKGELSVTLKKLQTQLDNRKKELDKIKSSIDEDTNDCETDYTEEELHEEISKQSLLKQKLDLLTKSIKEATKQLDNSKSELEKIVLSTRDLYQELFDIQIEMTLLEVRDKQHKKNNEEIQKYQEYKNKLAEYERWEDKLKTCKDEEIKSRKLLAMSETFLKKIQEAESIAISQTIDTINYYMNFYLDKFFPDNPITVEICPYKETKKDIKPTINIEVGYKGSITDINSLSGGEYDRVTLSIVLALNTIFGSNLLMLDESIVSLDVDLSNEILEVLKESLREKLVIVVAHQIGAGIFDNVINVDE